MISNTRLKFIDESPPEELVNLINSAYLSLCNSHNLGAITSLDDTSKALSILLQCELDHIGQDAVALDADSLQNGLLVIGLIGIAHNLKLWDHVNWSDVVKNASPSSPNTFHKRLFENLRLIKPQSARRKPKDLSV